MNGVFTLDAPVTGISDLYLKDKQGELDCEPGEMFFAEWRLRVDTAAESTDVSVLISSDNEAGDIDLGFTTYCVYSFYEYRLTEVDTTVWHTYRLESRDMLNYDFFIDGQYVYTGFFDYPGVTSSWVYFGDAQVNAISRSEWEYFRFGTARIGDLDANGIVDLNDFATFALCYGGAGVTQPPLECSAAQFSAADMDNDMDVDLGDFNTFAQLYGT